MKRLGMLVAVLAIVVVAGAAAAGNPEGGQPAQTGAPAKLAFLNHNTEKPERTEFFTRMAEKYRELHPNVTIEVTQTSFTDVNTQVLTAISSGAPYDLFTSFSMTLWRDKGVVLNLAPYLEANNGQWKSQLYDAVLQAITYPDGTAYMIPLWMDTTPLLYHKEIFTKLNLKVPTNTEEFITASEALKKAGYVPFQVHGSMMDDLLNLLAWQFAAKYGVKPYDVTQGKVPLTDPWFKDALRLMKDMYDRGYLPQNFWSMSGTEGRMGYSTAKMAMRFGFFWDVDTQKDMGMPYENQGVAAFPNVSGVAGLKVYKLLGLTGVMISKDTKSPQVAVDYLKYMVNEDNQDDMCYKYFGRYPNGMPAVNKAVKLSEYAMKYVGDLAAGVTTPYSIADVSLKYGDSLGQQLPLLMQGKITVDQCAAEMDKVRTSK